MPTDLQVENFAKMSYISNLLVVCLIFASLLTQCSLLADAKPSISFARLGQHKDNIIQAAGGFKQELLSPLIVIKQDLKTPFVRLGRTKLGLATSVLRGKVNLVRGVFSPVIGIKRSKLVGLRGILDTKINLLSRF